MAYISVGSIDDYYKKALEASKSQYEQSKSNINTMSDEQKKSVTDIYNSQIADTGVAYEDKYRENAVQKIINERDVAENMANLGLTNSGLNRTQQTAVQLSYANNKANIDRQKQAAVDSLAQALATELSGIETSRISALTDLENSYSKSAMENATKQRQADLDYNENLKKAEYDYLADQEKINANKGDGLYHFNRQSIDDSGDEVIVYDYNGKEKKVAKGVNPYTRNNNNNSVSVKTYGTFDNGYQPKGIKVSMEGRTYDYGKLKWTQDETTLTGKNQKIWYSTDETGKTRYWIWLGDKNAYQQLEYDSKTDEYKATSMVVYI